MRRLEEPTMPTIRVELFEGRSVEQKRALAQALTEATVRTLGGSADGVDVVFFDIARHDWATGGVLWSDKGVALAPSPGAAPGGAD
jgi:4-oxalocrotonate tautomerase